MVLKILKLLPIVRLMTTLVVFVAVVLPGCAATGEGLKGNVYKAGQVNTTQKARTIKITAVLPAKIEFDNTQQKKQAMAVGGILGALAGGIGGKVSGLKKYGVVGTTAGGAAAGVGAGSLVSDTVLVQGVSIAYIENGKIFTSSQVGELCEFKVNATALIITTGPNETRIQPNAVYPVDKENKRGG